MSAGKIAVAIIGAVIALAALGLMVSGIALTAVYATQRDDDGFFTSPVYNLHSDGYALVSEELDFASQPGDQWPEDLATVRLNVTSEDASSMFVGIGPTSQVNQYLSDVARDEVTDFGGDSDDVEYRSFSGAAPPSQPSAQTFWVISGEGPGQQSITWDVVSGNWMVVVMNADASSGVAVDAEAGARIGVILWIGIGLVVAGLLAGALATVLLVLATRHGGRGEIGTAQGSRVGGVAAPSGAHATGGAVAAARPGAYSYPVIVEGWIDPALSRWMWIVKWILAIPHYIVLWFLWVAFIILTIVAFFAILINSRYPRGIFDFNVGVLRWTWRVGFYTFSPSGTTALGTDRYPPFTLEDTDYPARLYIQYPERLSRGLVLVKWWLLAIPHYLIIGILTNGLVWWGTDIGEGDRALEFGGGLIGLLALFAGIALLFAGRYPRDLFGLIMGFNRWVFRVAAYAALMRDEYPPFRLDLGGLEQARAEPGPVSAD